MKEIMTRLLDTTRKTDPAQAAHDRDLQLHLMILATSLVCLLEWAL